ncbi:methylated-DNA--[protein]-cysteine S-methyltransferase [Reichenbachiella agarivorans]|uniref:Methylated-DNA--protein-cysteine methyltransferase n=1 Tax=Reichenbachiella agarivorans TaxID=2979464 RepID=A0ABY6CNN3_9BACT|nr:methylated-DNA--[protein]-cysteine S-methyltransferase [Reichenbachiella agarivorans]UXP30958.1 methylated-DNA--[protein]-cysteine S-methyltransferase [Reichenbachiella agarivorans]
MQNFISIQYYHSPVGELLLGAYENQLCICDWRYRKMRPTVDKRIQAAVNAVYVEQEDQVISQCITQLEEYFRKERRTFDIPLLMLGSDFQKHVWNELILIPFGETQSYMGLAQKLNNVGAIRAVASANGANALSILVPCHRIIGSDGDLTGYAGGLSAKKRLLELEGSLSQQMTLF